MPCGDLLTVDWGRGGRWRRHVDHGRHDRRRCTSSFYRPGWPRLARLGLRLRQRQGQLKLFLFRQVDDRLAVVVAVVVDRRRPSASLSALPRRATSDESAGRERMGGEGIRDASNLGPVPWLWFPRCPSGRALVRVLEKPVVHCPCISDRDASCQPCARPHDPSPHVQSATKSAGVGLT